MAQNGWLPTLVTYLKRYCSLTGLCMDLHCCTACNRISRSIGMRSGGEVVLITVVPELGI